MRHTCPVCGFTGLAEPPENFVICPSCGTEFGYTDFLRSHDELRDEWLASGARWHSTVIPPPPNWDGIRQLFNAGLGYSNAISSAVSQITVVELGRREREIAANSSFTAKVKERIIALGNAVPNIIVKTQSATA
jgi:hypothetical protein